MSEQPAVPAQQNAGLGDATVWFEGKAFTYFGLGPNPQQVSEFRGAFAEASARSWFQRKVYDPEINAVYLYRVDGEVRSLMDTWSDTYDGAVFAEDNGEDGEDFYDDLDEGR